MSEEAKRGIWCEVREVWWANCSHCGEIFDELGESGATYCLDKNDAATFVRATEWEVYGDDVFCIDCQSPNCAACDDGSDYDEEARAWRCCSCKEIVPMRKLEGEFND